MSDYSGSLDQHPTLAPPFDNIRSPLDTGLLRPMALVLGEFQLRVRKAIVNLPRFRRADHDDIRVTKLPGLGTRYLSGESRR